MIYSIQKGNDNGSVSDCENGNKDSVYQPSLSSSSSSSALTSNNEHIVFFNFNHFYIHDDDYDDDDKNNNNVYLMYGDINTHTPKVKTMNGRKVKLFDITEM